MSTSRAILLLILSACVAGCDEHPSAPPPAAVAHAGSVSGRVSFSGTAPVLPRLTVGGDPHCIAAHPDGVPDQSVVVAPDGAMANALVYLKDAARSDGSGREAGLIDQVGCQYVPHVVAVQINQPLRVKSSDDVLHNVNMLCMVNPPRNLAEPHPQEQTVTFPSPEMIRIRCDVHPWMKGVIAVVENPWFAVTGSDGKFRIEGVPPGGYTLACWHERFGELTTKIKIPPDGAAAGDFTYSP